MTGYFEKGLSSHKKQELLETISQYYQVYLPLLVPITLMNDYVRKYGRLYLKDKCYF